MRTLSPERLELIDAMVAEANIGDITAGLLEKDEHLTAALRAVFGLRFDHASLVFCGGTSLSKAHSLIERMSEDADIKVVLSPILQIGQRPISDAILAMKFGGRSSRCLRTADLWKSSTLDARSTTTNTSTANGPTTAPMMASQHCDRICNWN